jgi:hypothetical protein
MEYKLINSEKLSEYKVSVKETKNGTEYKMDRSFEVPWTDKGETISEAIDTGNEIIINDKTYDYDEFSELYHLMKVMVKHDPLLLEKFKIK